MGQSLLFADIDGTLVFRSLEQWLLTFMRKEKLIRYRQIGWDSYKHIFQWPPHKWYMWKLVYLQGHHEEEVHEWIQACWTEYIQPALIPESVQLVQRLRDQGVRVILLSGTFSALAEPLREYLNINETIFAVPDIKNHRYTGGLVDPHPRGMQKVHDVNRWLDRHQRSWEGTLAMADHWEDRHLLLKTDFPVAVHPKPKLSKLARKKGWAVLSGLQDLDRISELVTQYVHP